MEEKSEVFDKRSLISCPKDRTYFSFNLFSFLSLFSIMLASSKHRHLLGAVSEIKRLYKERKVDHTNETA